MGGLGILWYPTRVSLGGFHGNICLLSATFKVVWFSVGGMITNVYGPHNDGDKRDFIKSLWKSQERIPNDHWVVGGDFNLIASLEEKKGGQCRMEEECETFWDTIKELGLVDIIPGEGWFTCSKNRTGETHIASRLDRFLVFEYIVDIGSEIHSATILGAGSNHWPIELMWSGLGSQFKKTFEF